MNKSIGRVIFEGALASFWALMIVTVIFGHEPHAITVGASFFISVLYFINS